MPNNLPFAQYDPAGNRIVDPGDVRKLNPLQLVINQLFQSAGKYNYLFVGDSNQGRQFSTYNTASGGITIISPGIAELTLSSSTKNMAPGSTFRLNGDPSVPAFHGDKVTTSRVSTTVWRFATGETTQTAASTESISIQIYENPTCQAIPSFVAAYLRGKVNIYNRGDGGSTTAQLLARLDAYLDEVRPAAVDIQTITNDLTAGTAAATILSNLRACGEKIRAIGAVPIIGSAIPRGTGTADTAMAATIRTVNAGLLADMRAGLCYVADCTWPLLNPAFMHTTMEAGAANLADASHTTMTGAVRGFYARKPILDTLFGIVPPVADPAIEGLQNLTTNGFFDDLTGISAAVTTGSAVLSLIANPKGPGNILNIAFTASGADTCTLTIPDFHAALTTSSRYRMKMKIGMKNATNIRNIVTTMIFQASVQYAPTLLTTNITTSGATGANVPDFDMMEFEMDFVTPSAAASSSTPRVVITSGATGFANVQIAQWELYRLGAA